MVGMGATRKLDAVRAKAAALAPHPAEIEAARYKALAILWCKRALAAETQLAITVEGIVR
jgi:hypothetical protein